MIRRLDSLPGRVGECYRGANEHQRRDATLIICQFAAANAGLADPDVDAALDTLRGGAGLPEGLRERLNERSARFDELYFEASESDEAVAVKMFAKARAYSALAFALSLTAGDLDEAIYEATMAAEGLGLAVQRAEQAVRP